MNAYHKEDPASDDTLYILTAAASNSHYFVDELYGEIIPEKAMASLTFVPYYAWGNRGKGEMSVWVRRG